MANKRVHKKGRVTASNLDSVIFTLLQPAMNVEMKHTFVCSVF